MGSSSSKQDNGISRMDDSTIAVYEYGKAPPDCVHHYMAPNFPMTPILSAANILEMDKTWRLILAANTTRMRSYGKSGIVLFYDEFFFRLFQKDTSLETVFQSMTLRAEIIIKVISFMLKSDPENLEQTISKCNFLGHRHRVFRDVRAHHFQIFTGTLVEVVMYWLGEYATKEVGDAWADTVGFFCYNILEAFLFDKVDPFESYQNTTISAVTAIEESRKLEESETGSVHGDVSGAPKAAEVTTAAAGGV